MLHPKVRQAWWVARVTGQPLHARYVSASPVLDHDWTGVAWIPLYTPLNKCVTIHDTFTMKGWSAISLHQILTQSLGPRSLIQPSHNVGSQLYLPLTATT